MTMDRTADDMAAEEANLTAQAKLLRARADVTKAQSELDTARVPIDPVGSVTALTNGPTGAITHSDGAGKAEATLLAAWACNVAAKRIAAAVSPFVRNRLVAVIAGADLPSFSNYELFDLRVRGLRNALQRGQAFAAAAAERGDLLRNPHTLPKPSESIVQPMEDAISPITLAGTALNLISKLGTYFQSDYELGGLTITSDNDQFLAAVAGQKFPGGLSLPQKAVTTLANLEPLLADLDKGMVALDQQTDGLQRNAAQARATSDAEPDQTRKAALLASASAYEEALPQLRDVATKYDQLISGLSDIDATGQSFGAKVLQERSVYAALFEGGGNLVLRVNICASAGAYFTKKNIWTFLGSMPFYAMGAAVFSYTLMDLQTRLVMASGLVPVHSGYRKLGAIATLFGSATLHS